MLFLRTRSVPYNTTKATMEFGMLREMEEFLNQLIARTEGIRPEDVTSEYMRLQREWRFYPDMRYDIGSDPGMLNIQPPKFLTEHEMDAVEEHVERKLRELYFK